MAIAVTGSRIDRLLIRCATLVAILIPGVAWCQRSDVIPDADNGIYVGSAKVYDDRALSIMLDELNTQLKSFKTIDDQKTLNALLNQQGYSAVSTATAFQLTSPISPKVTTTKGLDDDGSLRVTDVVSESSENKPQPPSLPDTASQLAYAPTYGQSPQDLLSSQLNLTYQIYNIRMALERAVSDRLDGDTERMQAVLAFPISIDPPQGTQDRAAYVEISLRSTGGQHVSLVSLMPTEKSYNTAALSKKANAFGGSAVMSLFTLGLSRSRSSETFYVYQDVDTLAVQYPQVNSAELRFGWAFRPVLGRRSVSPGVRQLLAVVAVGGSAGGAGGLCKTQACLATGGDERGLNAKRTGRSGSDAFAGDTLEAYVKTYWRKYDRKRLTLGRRTEKVGAGDEAMTLSLLPTKRLHEKLAPAVESVEWSATGTDSAVSLIHGRNFFPGTQILLGDKVFADEASGLIIKSESTMEFRSSLTALALGSPFISGRYSGGRAQSVVSSSNQSASGIAISSTSADTDLSMPTAALTVQIQARDASALDEQAIRDRVLVSVGAHLALLPYFFQSVDCEIYARPRTSPDPIQSTCVEAAMRVPSEWLRGDVAIGMRAPFMPANWSDGWVSYGASKELKLVYLGGNDPVELALVGTEELGAWTLSAGHDYASVNRRGTSPVRFKIRKSDFSAYKRAVVVLSGGKDAELVDLPSAAIPPAKPSVDNANPPTVAVNYSGMVHIAGTNLDAIESAEFEGAKLSIDASKATSLGVFVTRKVTEKAGTVELLVKSAQGKIMPASLIVKP